ASGTDTPDASYRSDPLAASVRPRESRTSSTESEAWIADRVSRSRCANVRLAGAAYQYEGRPIEAQGSRPSPARGLRSRPAEPNERRSGGTASPVLWRARPLDRGRAMVAGRWGASWRWPESSRAAFELAQCKS